jgi:hypothetical protein
MYKIEYEIDLNDEGRPYIKLSEDSEDRPEDKFLVVEFTSLILNNILNNRKYDLTDETTKQLSVCCTILNQLSDQMASLLRDNMFVIGETSMVFDKYQVKVNTLDELYHLKDEIFYIGKLLKKQIGLKIFVESENKIFEFKDGINNENIVEFN